MISSGEVHELGGTSNVGFDYRITAIRRNYETARFADHANDPDPRKMLEEMHTQTGVILGSEIGETCFTI